METIYDKFDYAKRDTSKPFREFFTLVPEHRDFFKREFSPADLNFFDLMSEVGEDLSMLPMLTCPEEDKEQFVNEVQQRTGDCHNFAREIFHGLHETHPTLLTHPRLYWGVTDCYTNEEYRGIVYHSFLTYIRDEVRVLYDPFAIKHGLRDKGHMRSHFGIRLPYGYVADMMPRNYSYDIKNRIIHDRQETLEFMKMIKVAA